VRVEFGVHVATYDCLCQSVRLFNWLSTFCDTIKLDFKEDNRQAGRKQKGGETKDRRGDNKAERQQTGWRNEKPPGAHYHQAFQNTINSTE
jgi:hypothetical protein